MSIDSRYSLAFKAWRSKRVDTGNGRGNMSGSRSGN